MTFLGTLEALTCRGSDASLLVQYLDGWLASMDSLRTAAWVPLTAIPFADEALCDLATFAFVASHLFSAGGGGGYAAVFKEIILLIERLEKLHTKVQEIITSLHLAMTLLFVMSRSWSLYLNQCVTTLSLEDVGAPRETVTFSVETVILYLEVGGSLRLDTYPNPA